MASSKIPIHRLGTTLGVKLHCYEMEVISTTMVESDFKIWKKQQLDYDYPSLRWVSGDEWRPMDEYDLPPLTPVLVWNPRWNTGDGTSQVASAYWDEYKDGGSWCVCVFKESSAYHSEEFKPLLWRTIPYPSVVI